MNFTLGYDFYTYQSVKKESGPKLSHVRKCGQEFLLSKIWLLNFCPRSINSIHWGQGAGSKLNTVDFCGPFFFPQENFSKKKWLNQMSKWKCVKLLYRLSDEPECWQLPKLSFLLLESVRCRIKRLNENCAECLKTNWNISKIHFTTIPTQISCLHVLLNNSKVDSQMR